jgi:hypothetical protein
LFAPTGQGLEEVMFWFSAISLAAAAGFGFAFAGHRDSAL